MILYLFRMFERASFTFRLVACLPSAKVNDAVNPWHTYKSAIEQKSPERLQKDRNNGTVNLYLSWQNLPSQIHLVHKIVCPSRRSQFLGNWSTHSSRQDTESHPKRCRLIVFPLRLLWCCEYRRRAFPLAAPLPNSPIVGFGILVHWHDRGDLVFSLILLL